MEFRTILLEIRNKVAQITLNRPDAANTINADLLKDLLSALDHCEGNPGVRVIMISSAGKLFSGGGDLKTFSAAGVDLPALIRMGAAHFHNVISRLARMDIPSVAAIHGAVAGGGLSLAIACDIVIAAETTRFTVGYTRAGLAPDGGSTWFLPRLIGLKRALELNLTNRSFTAGEALAWGMITRVAPDDDLLTEAEKIASELAKGPKRAFGAAKRLLYNGWGETLESQMEAEAREISSASGGSEAREGIRAFLEKRAPDFTSLGEPEE
ncbi:MAG TPA: enoyl-CoA hydratase-related protein [Nitrospiria bacterium]|nr:enoyl-CoA hydratase-related protein [Nitrospiria bacterium]